MWENIRPLVIRVCRQILDVTVPHTPQTGAQTFYHVRNAVQEPTDILI